MSRRSFCPEPVRFMALAGLGSIVALGLVACSMPGKLSALGNPPDQHQDVTCDAPNTEHTRRAAGAASGDGLRRLIARGRV